MYAYIYLFVCMHICTYDPKHAHNYLLWPCYITLTDKKAKWQQRLITSPLDRDGSAWPTRQTSAITQHLQVICNSLGNCGQQERCGVADPVRQLDPLASMRLVLNDIVIYSVSQTYWRQPRYQETPVRQFRHRNVWRRQKRGSCTKTENVDLWKQYSISLS